MKSYKNQLITLFLLLVFCNAVPAVDFFEGDEAVIWKSGLNLYFKYTTQGKSKSGKNDHPVDMDKKDLINALKALKFTEKSFFSGETIRNVFSLSQMNLFAKQVAKGLKNAKSEQDIIFVMEGGSRKLFIATEKSFVAGRVFFKAGKLNIILGEYDRGRNDAFEKVYDPSGRAAVPYSFNHGLRSKNSKKFKGNVTGIPGVINKRFGSKLRQDWLVIDVETAAKEYLISLNKKENPSLVRNDKRLQVEAAKLARERRVMRAEMARMRKEMKGINLGGSASSKTSEERIVTLDALLAKNLITQEEYAIRRKKILDDI